MFFSKIFLILISLPSTKLSLFLRHSFSFNFVLDIFSIFLNVLKWFAAIAVRMNTSQESFLEIKSKSPTFLAPHSTTRYSVFFGMLSMVKGIPNSLFSLSLLA